MLPQSPRYYTSNHRILSVFTDQHVQLMVSHFPSFAWLTIQNSAIFSTKYRTFHIAENYTSQIFRHSGRTQVLPAISIIRKSFAHRPPIRMILSHPSSVSAISSRNNPQGARRSPELSTSWTDPEASAYLHSLLFPLRSIDIRRPPTKIVRSPSSTFSGITW